MNLSQILNRVPNYEKYMTVDELNKSSQQLASDHPDAVKVLETGKSASGEPIKCLKIGQGKHRALIYGFPNPEEPLGGLLLDYFSTVLAEDSALLRELDYTWYLIKCVDPDGTRLNEGFLKGPLTPIQFVKNYYRTPSSLSGEMNFPYRYGNIEFNNPMPETKALMNVLDQGGFDFISSLHNMKWGGITYEVPEPCPHIYAPLQQLAKKYGVFLRKRPGIMLAPGFQLAYYMTPARNYVRAKLLGKGPLEEITGAFTFEYALLLNPHAFMMIPECCLWHDTRMWDDSSSDASLSDVFKYARQASSDSRKFLLSTYEKAEREMKASSPFLKMIQCLVKEMRTPSISVSDPDPEFSEEELQRSATIAEKIGIEGKADIYRMFSLGAMIRMFDRELVQKGGTLILESCRSESIRKLEEWNSIAEKKYNCKHFPIRNLVSMNLGAILYSAEYAKWKKRSVEPHLSQTA
jgi:hypothetical protein